MKIVINAQYGGFNLSAEALKYLAEKGSRLLEKIPLNEYYGKDRVDEQWEKEKLKDIGDGWFTNGWTFFVTKKDGFIYHLDDRYDDKTRSHPDMIEVVEKLGEKANGNCATLKIVEVPDDAEIEIEEYDGIEWVSEKHRRWD